MAIHKEHHQKGIGTALLNDAIGRARQAAEIAGVTALLVHAISEQARRFYLSRGFVESPAKPMTLCLMLPRDLVNSSLPSLTTEPRTGSLKALRSVE